MQIKFIECTGITNLTAIEECLSYLRDLPLEVIQMALVKTSEIGGKWRYAKSILDDWLKRHIDTTEKVKAEEIAFKNRASPKPQKASNFEQRTYSEFDFGRLIANNV